ncbi:Hypothetical protein A7982_02521 [Minicystis rosea]|nr:Hypothetical protein A7982_02521 [Minicystis rosea]
MRRCVSVLVLGLVGCGKPDPPPVPIDAATAGLRTPLYQSGSRLKVRWAEPVDGDASVRVPIGVFDAKLGRDCVLERDDKRAEASCIPIADVYAGSDDIAFLDHDETEPVLLADDDACGRGADREPDHRLWEIAHHRDKSLNRYVAEEARIATRPWIATGVGCTPNYERQRGARCVKPLREADLGDVVKTKETRFGDPSGVVVAAGSDGSVLPLPLGAEYVDAADDIRCEVDADACVPRWPDYLDVTPTIGAEVRAHNYNARSSTKWAHKYGDNVWAALTPRTPTKTGRFESRKVLALLTPDRALRFAQFTFGEGRIVLRGKTLPDGRRVPIALHDTVLHKDCVPAQMEDGRFRCTVQLPSSCQATRVGEGDAKTEAISPSSSFCNTPETCCQGGVYWFPRTPARGPRRFDIGPDLEYHPAIPGRAARFSETPRTADHVEQWQPQVRRLVHDKVEDLGPEVFAELRIVRDP